MSQHQSLELPIKPMNNEVESFVGELRQLREREVKLARVAGLVETLFERNIQHSDGITFEDRMALDALRRSVNDPEISNLLDRLRQAGKIDVKRYPTPSPSRQQGRVQDADE